MSAHSILSPSSRHRWAACPGSVRESKKYPERKSGPAAIDGTHTHTLLERCVKAYGMFATEFIGKQLSDHEGEFIVDADRAERVQFALDYIWSLKGRVFSERKVDPIYFFGCHDLAGTVDVQVHDIEGETLHVIDYKDGTEYVPAFGNMQLEQYGFGVLAELAQEGSIPFDTIVLTIIQPKLRLFGQSGIESVEMGVRAFLLGRDKLNAEVIATRDPNAPLVPGEKQCKYCPHKGACAAATSDMMDKAGIQFENLDVAKQAAEKNPTELTDEQIRELVEAAPLLRKLLESVEAEAMRRFEIGRSVAGLKVVRGRGSRSWALDEPEMVVRLSKMGIPKGALYETKLISPSKAEKLTWKNRKDETEQLSERQLKILKDEYIKKSDGKLCVVPESDEREAVMIDASPMFGNVELPTWLS